jgi:segregation and condensation protein B
MTQNVVKRIIEGILFVTDEPISLCKIQNILESTHPLKLEELRQIINELKNEYVQQNRAFRLEEIANGYLLRTCEDLNAFIELLFKNFKKEKLSHSAAEVLAIVAYRQPITRPQIEEIRGVDSSGSVYTLIERQLIEPVGKLEVPGRPTLFGVTNRFLQHFGLRDVSDLPKI